MVLQQKLLVAAVALAMAFIVVPARAAAQDLTADEVRRVAPYYRHLELVDVPEPLSADAKQRLDAAIDEARREFSGRGPALARHFLQHIQASPGNSAFFFLFRAVGDADTARLLVASLLDTPQDASRLGRDPEEVSIAIEAVLQNDAVRTDPAVVAAIDETVDRARTRPGGGRVAEVAIRLVGRCRTEAATQRLRALATDPDRSIRTAAIEALGVAGSPTAAQTLQRALTDDPDPGARAQSAAALARGQDPSAAASLLASLQRESNPQVVDSIVRSLASLRALPVDPQSCLAIANRCWAPSIAQPLFTCWRATASRDDLIRQAASASWTVRALALRAITQNPDARPQGLVRMPQPLGPVAIPPRRTAFEPEVRELLLTSLVEMLSQRISGAPAPNTISFESAQHARDALWELSDRNMSAALEAADRIRPISGRYAHTGRFGASSDLALRDPQAYAARRRPGQLMAAAVGATLAAVLLSVPVLRPIAAGLLVSLVLWAIWFSFQRDVRELPPLPLAFFTASCLAFLVAGVVAGAASLLRTRVWLKVAAAALTAAAGAFLLCAVTRSAGVFPIGSGGWELILEPIGSALLAGTSAVAIALGLARWQRPPVSLRPAVG